MTTPANTPCFTLPERALLRHEFLVRFGQAPLLADGIHLRTWRAGPQAGQPKLPPAVASMIVRGLILLQSDRFGPVARFTEAGYVALRLLAEDRRALDPLTYAHLRQELVQGDADLTWLKKKLIVKTWMTAQKTPSRLPAVTDRRQSW